MKVSGWFENLGKRKVKMYTLEGNMYIEALLHKLTKPEY